MTLTTTREGRTTPRLPDRSRSTLAMASVGASCVLVAELTGRASVVAGVFGLIVLLLPTSETLSRRLVTNITLATAALVLVGWLPGEGTRIPVVLALAFAVLAARARALGLRRLLPRARAADWMLLAAVVTGLGISWPLTDRTPTSAMALLMGGWDHAGHFSMYLAQREGTANAVPAGQTWYYSNYPQLFHAVLARTSELVWGSPGTAADELVRYSTLQSLVFVGTAVVAVAVALDAMRHFRQSSRALGALIVLSLVLGFPGASLLMQGYLSVQWSAVAAVVLLQLARRSAPLRCTDVLVAASCLVGVAAWPLLLPLVALPAAGLAIRGLRSPRWQQALTVAAAAAAIGGCGYLIWVSGRADPTGHIVTAGGIIHTGAVLSFGVPLCVVAAAARGMTGTHRTSWIPVLLAAGTFSVVLIAIALFQLHETGALSYYFWKTALIGQTVLLTTLAPDVARYLAVLPRRRWGSDWPQRLCRGTVVGLVTAGGLGAATGQPALATAAVAPVAMRSWGEQQALAEEVFRTSHSPAPLATSIWLRESDAYAPALPDQWLHSITRSRTVPVGEFQTQLNGARFRGAAGLESVGEEVLRNSTLTVLVSDPHVYRELLARVGPQDAQRVVLLP